MEIIVTDMVDHYACEIYDGGISYGVLYFELAKVGYRVKPIVEGYVCVDAKISDNFYEQYDITPIDLIDMCRGEIGEYNKKRGG